MKDTTEVARAPGRLMDDGSFTYITAPLDGAPSFLLLANGVNYGSQRIPRRTYLN